MAIVPNQGDLLWIQDPNGTIHPGDFVQINYLIRDTDPRYDPITNNSTIITQEVHLYGVRSVFSDEIIIYPLHDQTTELRLVSSIQQNKQWVLYPALNYPYRIKYISGTPTPFHNEDDGGDGGYFQNEENEHNNSFHPNIIEWTRWNDTILDRMITVQQLNQAYNDLSLYGITPQQFIRSLQCFMYSRGPCNFYSGDKTIFVEWLIEHDMIPSEYDLGAIIDLGDISILQSIDNVSSTPHPYSAIAQNKLMSDVVPYIPLPGVIQHKMLNHLDVVEYFANKRIIPKISELKHIVKHDILNEIFIMLVTKGLVRITRPLYQIVIDAKNEELLKFLRSPHTTTKSAIKR